MIYWLRIVIFNIVFLVYLLYVHELGHVISYWWFTKRIPKIHFKLYGIFIKDLNGLSIKQAVKVAFWGIYAGYLALIIPFAVLPVEYFLLWVIGYMTSIIYDVVLIFIAITIPKDKWYLSYSGLYLAHKEYEGKIGK